MTMQMNLHPQYITTEDGEKISVILPIDEYNKLIKEQFTDDLSHLNDEVEKGFNSKLSTKTHKEIFKELKQKYA